MNKLSTKLKYLIRRWLGLGETFIGVDLGMRDQSAIVIVSRLNGGSVRIIDAYFDNQMDMERLVKELQQRYGVNARDVFRDYPPHVRRMGDY